MEHPLKGREDIMWYAQHAESFCRAYITV